MAPFITVEPNWIMSVQDDLTALSKQRNIRNFTESSYRGEDIHIIFIFELALP